MRPSHIYSFALLIISLSASLVFADYDGAESTSGKRKIAFAPYQKIAFTHTSPRLKHTDDLTSSDWQMKQLNIEEIVKRAGRAGDSKTKDDSKGMIAAGWPGGKQPSSQPAAAPAKAPHPNAPKAPTSQRTTGKAAPTSQASGPAVSGFIYGQLNIDEALKSKVKAGSILFVIVRRFAPEGQKGMMIAATKLEGITSGAFPLKYVVKQSDAMMGAPLVGKVSVSARIDQDGDAISKQPGDIIGSANKAVMVGVNRSL